LDVNQLRNVARTRPAATLDSATPTPVRRTGRDGSDYVLPLMPTMAWLADEGSYRTVANAQTGLATAAAPTAFSATNPFLTIYNSDSIGGKRIYLDYITLICTAVGTGAASIQAAVVVDTGNRYSSGGSSLTANVVNPNMDVANGTIAVVNAGNVTATAASGAARTVIGQRALKGAIGVVGDNYTLAFGGVDKIANIVTATLTFSSQSAPPVVIGPGQTALLHLWFPSQSAASSYIAEAGWGEF